MSRKAKIVNSPEVQAIIVQITQVKNSVNIALDDLSAVVVKQTGILDQDSKALALLRKSLSPFMPADLTTGAAVITSAIPVKRISKPRKSAPASAPLTEQLDEAGKGENIS